MKAFLPFIALAGILTAQSPDAFTGAWKLNIQKSRFGDLADSYLAGSRTYAPTSDGMRVTWTMKDPDGAERTGEYTVRCEDHACASDVVNWKVKDSRTVVGEMFENGSLSHTYTRTVTSDHKQMTISFHRPGQKKPSSVQVWERQ